ncbi:single-stranded DNA-binding protein [Candidatus Nephthysia bennettiae]|uniref:Single-stranded DNA-binding protein n=1 Tax=Candidatus Nephthysia bennettiae TaxID=3127016 RepID=A0A934NB44_9BACT|nr:single-stranded DNA-binding protein [Candidatus Dormibacteraeota bacterium]MBJ7611927.1 single-stranded DNA-binding protein [Candidatus Dormibacteraeota bacterium]
MGEVIGMNGTAEATGEQRSRGPAVNEVRLLGRLAANPDMRFKPDGKPVTELRVVTNERPEAEFHDVVTYGRLAEVVGEYVRKGGLVYVNGRLHAQTWKAQDGSPRRRVVVIAESVQFLGRSGQEEHS